MNTQGKDERALLRRTLGSRDVLLYFITAGVNLQWVATAAMAGASALTLWLVACATMSLPLAFCVVELASRYPDEGGIYVWSKRAFGDFVGFMTGWTYWLSGPPYYPGVLYFVAGNALYIAGDRFQHLSGSPAYFLTVSLLGLTLVTVLHLVGLQVGKWLSNLGAITRWLATLALLVMGAMAWLKFGSATKFNLVSLRPGVRPEVLFLWSTIAFALTGLESASVMGEEIKDSRRALPRAILTSAPLIAVIYFLGTASVLVALPAGELTQLQGIMEAMAAAARRLGLEPLTPMIAVLITLSALGSVGAWLGSAARLYFVAGIDRFLPPAFARIHPRWRTPHVALLTEAAIALICVLLSQVGTTAGGAYNILVSMTVITTLIPFLFLFAAAIRLQREPAGPGVIRMPGGRPVAILLGGVGFLTTAVSIVLSVFPLPGEPHPVRAVVKVILLTLALVGSGAVIYAVGRRRQRRVASPGSAVSRV